MQIKCSTFINRTNQFGIKGLLGSNFIKFYNLQTISGDHDQTPHSVASDLGLYCVPMAQRKALGLYGFRFFFNLFLSNL